MPQPIITHKRIRCQRNKEVQRKFLDAYIANGGNIYQAAEAVGISYANHHRWLKKEPEYAEKFEIAREAIRSSAVQFTKLLERQAVRLAVDGVIRKKFNAKGEPVIDPETGEQYEERQYDSRVLIKLLEGACPERYRNSLNVVQTTNTGISVSQVAGDVDAMAATIRPPAEVVQAALHAWVVKQLQSGGEGGGNGNGNGHNGHANGNGNGHAKKESDQE